MNKLIRKILLFLVLPIAAIAMIVMAILLPQKKSADSSSGSPYGFQDDGSYISRPVIDPSWETTDTTMTIMVYMIGSDLETAGSAGSNDMLEMEESGIDTEKVNLLLYTGGSPAWHNDTVTAGEEDLFLLEKDGFKKLESYPLASMGEPSSLAEFLTYGYTNYPAEEYALILWDHGNGPLVGYGKDILFGNDALTLPEIAQALEDSPFGKDNKLSFIGFDACLMASAELACTVSDYASYLVASQEAEPGFGWNYAFLQAAGKVKTEDLARSIVNCFVDFSNDYYKDKEFFKCDVTLSVVDLSKADQLGEAIDSLFSACKERVSGDYNHLAKARVETRSLGRASTGSEYDLVDLYDLMVMMSVDYPKAAGHVISVLDDMIIYEDDNTEGLSGLSFYYPYYNKRFYERDWESAYEELGLFPSYVTYLERFSKIWMGTTLREYFGEALLAEETEPGIYQLRLNEEQQDLYARAGYYILRRTSEGTYSVVYVSSNVSEENGIITANFDGKILYYENDYGLKGIPVAIEKDRVGDTAYYTATVHLTNGMFAQVRRDASAELDFAVDLETEEVSITGIWDNDTSDEEQTDEAENDSADELQTGKRREIDPLEFNRYEFMNISSRYLTRDENGAIMDFWAWPQNSWITWAELPTADGLHFTYEPIYDDGYEYFLMFRLYDVQNNGYSSELLPVTLAKAPEVSVQENIRTISWDDGSECVFYDDNGITLKLIAMEDPASGQRSLVLEGENTGTDEIAMTMDDLILDGEIDVTEHEYILIDAESVDREEITSLQEILRLTRRDLPESLTFTLRINNSENYATIEPGEVIEISISDDIRPQSQKLDIYGAFIDPQRIMEEDGFTFDILKVEHYKTTRKERCILFLKIENQCGEHVVINIDAMVVNGVRINIQDRFLLPDDYDTYHLKELPIDMETLKEAGIEHISSMRLDILVEYDEGSEIKYYPQEITLRAGAEETEMVPPGVLVYEDEYFALYNAGAVTERIYDGSYRQEVDLWVRNKTQTYLNLEDVTIYADGYADVETDGIFGGMYVNVGPGELVRTNLFVYDPYEEPELMVAVVIRDRISMETFGLSDAIDLRPVYAPVSEE